MEVRDFVGKTVICSSTKERCRLERITSAYIDVATERPNTSGYLSHYRFECTSVDPISSGTLVFEDTSLTELFKKAYEEYCYTGNAYYENYGYWLRRGY